MIPDSILHRRSTHGWTKHSNSLLPLYACIRDQSELGLNYSFTAVYCVEISMFGLRLNGKQQGKPQWDFARVGWSNLFAFSPT
jgi:hypothetical protein